MTLKLQKVRGEMTYEVTFSENTMPVCTCQKPQLTGIPCNHVLAVCSKRNLNETQYVSPFYSLQAYTNTWTGEWHSFGNETDWPQYYGPAIRPAPGSINRGRRKHKRIPMVMDIMEGRARVRNKQARRPSKQSRMARNAGMENNPRYFN